MRKTTLRSRLCVERLEPRLCMAFGALDTSFGADGFVRFENMQTADSEDEAYAVAAYPDGSVVMAGISEVGRGAVSSFAKLDSAGQLVTSFGVDGQVLLPYALTATTAVAASDGSLYISGARLINDAYRNVVMRMRSDGTIDSSFGGAGYHVFDTAPNSYLSLAPTFDAGVAVLACESYGLVPAPSEYRIWKLDASGQLDPNFGTAGVTQSFDPCHPLPASTVPSYVVQFLNDDAGRLVVVGKNYSQTDRTHYLRALRFTADGLLDTTFGNQGSLQDLMPVSANFKVAAEKASGGAVLVVWADAKSASTIIYARRVLADGSADVSFGSDGLLASPALPPSVNPSFSATPLLAANGPGRTLVTVPRQETLSRYRFVTIVIGADGQFDTAFGDGGVGQSASYEYSYLNQVGAVVDADGQIRIAASGYSGYPSVPPIDWRVFGLDANGNTDTTYGQTGTCSIDFTQPSSYVRWLDVQPIDTSLVAVHSPDLGLRNPQPPDVGDAMVEYFYRTGDRNTDHASGGDYSLGAMSPEHWLGWSPVRDGGLLTASVGSYNDGSYPFSVRKRLANGQFDDEFGQDGWLTWSTEYTKYGFRPVIKQSATGQIYVALQTTKSTGGTLGTAWVAKANELGQLDASFGTGGIYRIDDDASELTDFVVSQSGRLYLLLTGAIYWSTRKLSVIALNAAGHVDTSFANQGTLSLGLPKNAETLSIAEDKTGRLLVLYRSNNELHVHRLTAAGQSDGSFGGDGDVLLPATTRSIETLAELAVLGDQAFVAATTGITTTETTVFALRADGSLNADFGQSGAATFDFGQYEERVRSLLVLLDGSVLLGLQTIDGLDSLGQFVKLGGMDPSPVPLHNVYLPLNTTPLQDDVVSPRDALLVINYLILHRADLPGARDPAQMGYVDVNADNFVSPIDALLIINYLIRASNGPSGGEGEGDVGPASSSTWEREADLYWATVFASPDTTADAYRQGCSFLDHEWYESTRMKSRHHLPTPLHSC